MSDNIEKPATTKQIFLPLIFMSCIALGFMGGLGFKNFVPAIQPNEISKREASSISSIDEIIRFIQARYVDKLSYEELTDKTIHGILSQLDPHSTYITKDELKAINEEMEGDFDGVGIEFLLVQDTINVVSTVYGGPAEKVGILAGDKIISVNDTVVAGKKIDNIDVTKYLKGKKGTMVKVGIKRKGKSSLLYFNVTRDQIPFNSIDAAISLDNKTALIKINRFSAKTYQEFMGAVDSLFIKGKKENLILDLRQNPGGYLQEATNILSQLFAERNKLLVYTKGRNFKRTDYETNGRSHIAVKKIAVLIDEGSASASEIVAGAVQDWDKGVIIGRRSFGKGLVQEQYDLANGGALRLTIARYYTPSGRCIQKDFDHYEDEINDRLKDGELLGKIRNVHKDSTIYKTSKGRIVYGSGGISPDIFIPFDSSYLATDYFSIRQAASEFAIAESNSNRSFYPGDVKKFIADKDLQNKVLARFELFVNKKSGTKNSDKKFLINEKLSNFIMARLARQLYGANAFFLIQSQKDEFIQKALKQFNEPKLISAK